MAELFNPVVQKFRLHGFAARSSFDLLNPTARSAFAHSFLTEDCYYTADPSCPSFTAVRLGRRFQQPRVFKSRRFRPHGFWGLYMSQVAGQEYRGPWRGLAPMRVVFREPGHKWLRVSPEVLTLLPEIKSVRAFPNCYIFPIGWTTGIVIDIQGNIPLATCTALAACLRQESVFLWQGKQLTLQAALSNFNDTIRKELVTTRPSYNPDDGANSYLVASPLVFEEQGSFEGRTEIDLNPVIEMLAGGALASWKMPIITRELNTFGLTVLNRGTFVIASRPERDSNIPGCTCSNLKNVLLVTTLMQKFHQNSLNHRNPLVTAMRTEVAETFKQLRNSWQKPHFNKICELHTGIRKMEQEPVRDSAPINYFISGNFIAAGGKMSSFNFNAPVTNAAIGDHATFNQNLQKVDVKQLASDLDTAYGTAQKQAKNDTEKADAAKIGEAAKAAKDGDKSKAGEILRQVGSWGLNLLKEIAVPLATEGLKALLLGL